MKELLATLFLLVPAGASAELSFEQIVVVNDARRQLIFLRSSPAYDSLSDAAKADLVEIDTLLADIGSPSNDATISAMKDALQAIKDSQ